MQTDWLAEADDLKEEFAALREAFHEDPEIGEDVPGTASRIEDYLGDVCHIPASRPVGNAVVGVLAGSLPGPTVALRSDMDALPVTEETDCLFRSRTSGRMHACGHDVHMASALGAARLLSLHRNELSGTVKFLFEPDEEGTGGAREMIASGCADGCTAVFGCHVDPHLPAGVVGIRYGRFYAASDTFAITILGKGAHAARPEEGIDALRAACLLTLSLEHLPSYCAEKSVVTVGKLNAGTGQNVLAAKAELSGLVRTLGEEDRKMMERLFAAVCHEEEKERGVSITLDWRPSYSGVTNPREETDFVKERAESLLGKENVRLIEEPTMTTEDVGYFIEKYGGCYYHIGAGSPYPLHSPRFLPDPKVVPIAAALHASILSSWLEKAEKGKTGEPAETCSP